MSKGVEPCTPQELQGQLDIAKLLEVGIHGHGLKLIMLKRWGLVLGGFKLFGGVFWGSGHRLSSGRHIWLHLSTDMGIWCFTGVEEIGKAHIERIAGR